MSRIGKKPILIPQGVESRAEGQEVFVKGPKGEISKKFRSEIDVEVKDNKIFVFPKKENSEKKKLSSKEQKKIRSFWGLTRALIANMVEGVVSGFEKKLVIEGVGFKAEVSGEEFILYVGFTHPLKFKIPEGVEISVQKNIILISGIDKEKVGQLASIIRKSKPAEPYKGKGIKYLGEVIRRKVGKKATSAAA